MILIGGQRPLTARASFSPPMAPGIWISVKHHRGFCRRGARHRAAVDLLRLAVTEARQSQIAPVNAVRKKHSTSFSA